MSRIATMATRNTRISASTVAQKSLPSCFLQVFQTLSSENALSARPVTARCMTAALAIMPKKMLKPKDASESTLLSKLFRVSMDVVA